MKAITLRQPYASLVAAGMKTVETRPRACSYRGRIAIHAAKSTQGIDDLPGDCEGKYEGGWVYGYIGDYQASYCRWTSDEGRRGDAELCATRDGTPLGLEAIPLPLGAVVASAVLTDCVPIVNATNFTEDDSTWPAHAFVAWDDDAGLYLVHSTDYVDDGGLRRNRLIEDQLPFGDFSPGRWALLLTDIAPTTERCPWCWGDGGFKCDSMTLYGVPGGEDWADPCPVCNPGGRRTDPLGVGAYGCDSVPARGQQAVPWEWSP